MRSRRLLSALAVLLFLAGPLGLLGLGHQVFHQHLRPAVDAGTGPGGPSHSGSDSNARKLTAGGCLFCELVLTSSTEISTVELSIRVGPIDGSPVLVLPDWISTTPERPIRPRAPPALS